MARKRRRRTSKTRSFGTSSRISHDATPFYAGRLYDALPQEDRSLPYQENPVPGACLDQILCRSSEQMAELPDHSVHLMITSPPYNVGKVYDADLPLRTYLKFLQRVWQEVHRVLVPGGRACINIANLGRKPYIPLHAFITQGMIELGFLMRGEIIWNKSASAGVSTAWGSWMSATNPTLRDVHEYVLVFSKGTFRRQKTGRPSTISKEDFLEFTKSVWDIATESARKIGHPAPFPVELPRRLIQLYTFQGDVVLDPFIGSGQTALATLGTGRHYVGYEIDETYAQLARRRIEESEQK